MIEKILRDVPLSRDAALDERTVAVLCERLRETARLLGELSLTTSPIDRAESFRYLLTMVAYAIDAGLLNPDPLEPMFSQPYRLHLLDWGGASPDSLYRRAMVRDDRSYRVHGRLGNASYFSIDFRQSVPACTITRDELGENDDGTFEVFLGGTPREKSWWPLIEGTSGLVVRELFDDWAGAQRSVLRIECLDGETAPRPEHSSGRVAAEFDMIGEWVLEGAVRYWAEQSASLAERSQNRFLAELQRRDTKLPVVTFAWWDLQPDEALVLELRDPEAAYWGLHLVTSLWHTLDYANRLTTFNATQSHRDPDGVYRFVVSGRDPHVYNWLDTTGLERGIVILRFVQAGNAAPPETRMVKVSDVASVLAGTRRCSADERRTQIGQRREGLAHMLLD